MLGIMWAVSFANNRYGSNEWKRHTFSSYTYVCSCSFRTLCGLDWSVMHGLDGSHDNIRASGVGVLLRIPNISTTITTRIFACASLHTCTNVFGIIVRECRNHPLDWLHIHVNAMPNYVAYLFAVARKWDWEYTSGIIRNSFATRLRG